MTLSQQDLKEIELILNRKPTKCEEHIFDTMWSEHCSYKSSKPVLKKLPTEASSVALGIGEDAGIIRFHKKGNKSYCIAISHESHNHPSQILPIEGAATGVGGCVRDVYCMGADVIGVLNSLHFGINKNNQNPLVEEIEKKVVQGISGYGNPLGVPVLGGETLYHESYNDNCLVNVAALGLIEEEDIVHSYVPEKAKEEPYVIILFGKSTDQTGFGGASFSSETLNEENEDVNIGAVQVHDPFLKRVLVEAIKKCLDLAKKEDIEIGFKDLGAGGISCAASEIAVAGGFGVYLDLDKVNVSNHHLNSEVIACSETQERFCLAVPKKQASKFCDIFNVEFALPTLYPMAGAYIIGDVTEEMVFKIKHKENIVCNLPVASITTEVNANRKSKERFVTRKIEQLPMLKPEYSVESICLKFLDRKINASKKYVYRFFDNAVKGNTVIYPGEADAVVVKPIDDVSAGLAASMDSNLYGKLDPYVSGAYAVAESIRNLVSVGATPIALTDCLNYGNPEKENVFYDFEQGVEGIKDASLKLSFTDEPIPIISGNVSFYNESVSGNAVVPSPVVCSMGKVSDISTIKTCQVFEPDLDIVLIGKRYAEFGETQIKEFIKSGDMVAPQVRFSDEIIQNKSVLDLYKERLVESCHDISMGGMWLSLVEKVLGEKGNAFVGVSINLEDSNDVICDLFSENGGYLISTKQLDKVEKILLKHSVFYRIIGKTIQAKKIDLITNTNSYSFSVEQLESAWNKYN